MQLSNTSAIGSRIRVLLVADHIELQEALVDLLGEEPDVELAGIARTVADAVEVARCQHPDVLLIDFDMAGGAGEQVITEVSGEMPETKQIAMSMSGDRDTVLRIQKLGAEHVIKGADVVDSMKGFFEKC